MEDLKSSDRTIGSYKRTLPNNAYIVHVDLQYASGVGVIDPGKVNSPLEPKSQLPLPSRNLNPNSKHQNSLDQEERILSLALSTHQHSPHTRTPPQIQNESL